MSIFSIACDDLSSFDNGEVLLESNRITFKLWYQKRILSCIHVQSEILVHVPSQLLTLRYYCALRYPIVSSAL